MLRSLERSLSDLAYLLADFIEAEERSSTKAVLFEVIYASFTRLDRIDYNHIKLTCCCCRNSDVVLVCYRAKVTKSSEDTLQLSLLLSILQFSYNAITIDELRSLRPHVIDLLLDFTNLLLVHSVLLPQAHLALLLFFSFILNWSKLLLKAIEVLLSLVLFGSIRIHLVIALLNFTSNLVSSFFDALNFSLFAFDVSFDLSHLIEKLVERGFNLFAFLPQLFSLLTNLHVHPLKYLLFLYFLRLLFS